MRKLLFSLSVALLTFAAGLCAAGALRGRPEHVTARAQVAWAELKRSNQRTVFFGPTTCTLRIPETADDRAKRLAVETAIAHSGYAARGGGLNALEELSPGGAVPGRGR